MPKRIQRKRTKGWRMPPNTVYVGRPTKWGNPYRVQDWGHRGAVLCYEDGWMDGEFDHLEQYLHELRGKNLACWCSLDKPCHADVLLKLANESS